MLERQRGTHARAGIGQEPTPAPVRRELRYAPLDAAPMLPGGELSLRTRNLLIFIGLCLTEARRDGCSRGTNAACRHVHIGIPFVLQPVVRARSRLFRGARIYTCRPQPDS